MARGSKRSGDRVYRPGSYPANESPGRHFDRPPSQSDMNDASRNRSAGNNEKMPTFSDSNWAYDNAGRGRKDSDGDYD